MNVFHQLVQKYRNSLSSSIDDAFYNGIGLIIGLIQSNYHLLELNDTTNATKAYNFYKDSNIPEIHRSTDLLNRLEARVVIELNQWPDHAVLSDVNISIFMRFICFYLF